MESARLEAPLRFLVFATEWDSGHGGLSTFNRGLCRALAKLGHEVFCALPTADDDVRRRALVDGVTIVTPPTGAGVTDREALLYRRLDGCTAPHVVVGHGRFTGPYAEAQQRDFFPTARRIHIFHVNPRKIEPFKGADGAVKRAVERHQAEAELAAGANLLLAVGPALRSAFSTYLNDHSTEVHEILPGIAPLGPELRVPAQFTVLMLGRMEDRRLKGVDITIEAMKMVLDGDQYIELHILGVEPEVADAQQQELTNLFGDSARVEPFTADGSAVSHAICCASVVVMPSRSEGFGLVGLEALEQGVPVIVTERSGLAQTLQRHAPDDAAAFIVPADDPEDLAQRIADIRRDEDAARERARRLHNALAPHLQWTATAQRIVNLLGAAQPPGGEGVPASAGLPPAPQPPESIGEPLAQASPPTAYERVARLFQNASQGLATWPSTLASGHYLERTELQRITSLVDQGKRVVLLLGQAGTGKSALLARATDHYVKAGKLTLSIKADQLSGSVSSDWDLGRALGFSNGALETIEAAAGLGTVVVLIDQLDALADLVDYKTSRLDVLLDLIDDLLRIEGVSVIASSRAFEANHDLRLAELVGERVDLGPLPKETVFGALGVPAGAIPAPALELLRFPLWLRLFSELRAAIPGLHFPTTEYELLAQLWSHHAERSQPTQGLCAALTSLIENTEELWIPTDSVQVDPAVVQRGVDNGLLRMTADGSRVGFAHQRLFEFSRARRFTDGGIADYAIKHQDGLASRSTIWAGLSMCRQANPRAYRQELESLSSDRLRLHVRVLIVELLASVQAVTEVELRWVLTVIAHAPLRRRFFESMAGNEAWFRKLNQEYLPAWMDEFGGELVGVLRNAWPTDTERVTELLRDHWLPVEARRNDMAYVLAACARWDNASILLVQHLARGAADYGVEHAVRVLFEHVPDAGARAFVAMIDQRIRNAVATPPNGASLADRERALEDSLKRLEFHDAEKYAARSPEIFLDGLDRTLRSVFGTPNERLRYLGHILGAERMPSDLLDAVQHAFQALLERNLEKFREYVERYASIQLSAVQTVVSRVLTRSAKIVPDLVVKFLVEDERRLLLEHEANALLVAVGDALSAGELASLHDAIEKIAKYTPDRQEDVKVRRDLMQANRRYRLWLLEALNRNAKNAELLTFVESERSSFQTPYESSMQIFQHTFQSVMSAVQMAKADDADILGFLKSVPDSSGWDHPTKQGFGGSIEASREFLAFSKDYPTRALAILRDLQPEAHEQAAAHGLLGAAKSGNENERVEESIWELDERGFRSNTFRADAASALDEFAGTTGLSDRSIQGLERWLGEIASHAEMSVKDDEGHENASTVIWGFAGRKALPHGTWPVLDVLIAALLFSPHADYDRLERILLDHAQRSDDVEIWRAFLLLHGQHLRAWGSERAEGLIDALLSNCPRAIASFEGAWALAHARWWAPPEKLKKWIVAVQESNWKQGRLAAGELIGLAGLHVSGPLWARNDVQRYVEKADASDPVLLGITNSAANLWGGVMSRQPATAVLCAALATEDQPLSEAALAYIQHGEMRPDSSTLIILNTLLRHRPALSDRVDHRLVSQLATLVAWKPRLICEVAKVVIEKSDPARMHTDWFGIELVQIALTAHRLHETREQGLRLFEDVLGLGVRSADAALSSVDGRSRGGEPSFRVPRSRGRKKRRRET